VSHTWRATGDGKADLGAAIDRLSTVPATPARAAEVIGAFD